MEKELIKAEFSNAKKNVVRVFNYVFTIPFCIYYVLFCLRWLNVYLQNPGNWTANVGDLLIDSFIALLSPGLKVGRISYALLAAGLLTAGVLYLKNRKIELIVTDKRVYGKRLWGKEIDLPIHMISSIEENQSKGIVILTSSEEINFSKIINKEEVYDVISKLLTEHQNSRWFKQDTIENQNAERTLIKGSVRNIGKMSICLFAALMIIFTLLVFAGSCWYNSFRLIHGIKWFISYAVVWHWGILLVSGIIALAFYFALYKTELIVTNKRVFGRTSFGKRVDLPIDSISAVGIAAFKSITVTTSSGAIKFRFIPNRREIHSVIANLLVQRQDKGNVERQVPQDSVADLKRYKAILDEGIITQEEFDAKKRQLLGL